MHASSPVSLWHGVALWHGAGNTFALHDGLGGEPAPNPAAVCTETGVDGFVALTPPRTPGAAASLAFFNPDGAPADACGNGLRCAAACLDPHGTRGTITFDTPAGLRTATALAGRGGVVQVRVSMGKPRFRPPPDDPLAFAEFLPNQASTGDSGRPGLGTFGPPIRVDLGNPHAVFLVDEAPGDALVGALGPALQSHPLFAAGGGVNVGFAFVHRPDAITLRVFERGVGETASCGSGACAAVAAAIAVRRCVRQVIVAAPGGELTVDWPAGGEMFLTGPAAPLPLG
ncbi:diaminopimelate epimerase [Alienimonas californiensis]|uniref:Diaminopimelate epimerase n=1 Tax=Alienimonas californiensis TaxID=2527989 RepID=A0A517P815_9PLAN|nr:diaminopimelate epimerase [Alienimonas californiensis]QDT15502.1 Diaminopimelate epimerase [Alienimonas californiensis]